MARVASRVSPRCRMVRDAQRTKWGARGSAKRSKWTRARMRRRWLMVSLFWLILHQAGARPVPGQASGATAPRLWIDTHRMRQG